MTQINVYFGREKEEPHLLFVAINVDEHEHI